MNTPKRHHWWPQLQSGHWTDGDGLIHVTRSDGSTFRAPPSKIGVEGDLYTRYELEGLKDLTVEKWFSEEIEGPFVSALNNLSLMDQVTVSPIPAKRPDKEQELRELGFKVPRVVERLSISSRDRDAINGYLAALLVRNPLYLAKLVDFHDREKTPLPLNISRSSAIKTVAIDNMIYVFNLYKDRIATADLGLLLAEGSNEFLFADCGISAQEPWRQGIVPFDIHAPLTPRMALEVLPVQGRTEASCFIMRVNAQGAARMNRIVLGNAQRFVFSRQKPPIAFIKENFGKPAPKSIGIRSVGGRIDTKFDRSRDRG